MSIVEKIKKILAERYPDGQPVAYQDRLSGNVHVVLLSETFKPDDFQKNADELWAVLVRSLEKSELLKVTLAMAISPNEYEAMWGKPAPPGAAKAKGKSRSPSATPPSPASKPSNRMGRVRKVAK